MRQLTVIEENELRRLQERIAMCDEKAFRQLFDYFSGKLFFFAMAIVKNKEGALEIVDEVFVKIWKNRSTITSISHIKVYLYTSVKNASLNYLARKANEQITETFDFIDIQVREDYCPYQQMVTADIFKKIQEAVNELPPRCKMIFKLVREDGLKYREVADILNISANTVDAQMVIAVQRISEKVKRHFDFFPARQKKVNNS